MRLWAPRQRAGAHRCGLANARQQAHAAPAEAPPCNVSEVKSGPVAFSGLPSAPGTGPSTAPGLARFYGQQDEFPGNKDGIDIMRYNSERLRPAFGFSIASSDGPWGDG